MDMPGRAFTRTQTSAATDFGKLLRRARERRGKTLQDLSSETRIPRRYLDALEHGHLDALPGGIYRRNETRAYAQAVGLDERLALSELERALRASTPPEPVRVETPMPSRLRSNPLLLVAGAVVAGVFLLAIGARSLGVPKSDTGNTPAVRVSPPAVQLPAAKGLKQTTVDASWPASPILQETQPTVERITARDVSGSQVVEPVTPIATDGQLVVNTAPAGARVTVDGIGWGVTPITIPNMAFGTKQIRISRDGYLSEQRFIRLDANRSTQTLTVDLTPAP